MSKKRRKSEKQAMPKKMGSQIHTKENHHAYLNALGIKSTEACIFNSTDDTDSRQKTFRRERRTHSFDSRETWSLDYTLATWLYEHLMMYKDYADDVVDLSYHVFTTEKTHVTKKGHVKTKKVELTEGEALDLACKYLRRSLTCAWDDDRRIAYEQAALRIVTDVLPSLWW